VSTFAPFMGFLALSIGFFVAEVILLVAALVDLTRPNRRVRDDNKIVWVLIVIFVPVVGPILYFLIGREL
jgi:uncharacterized membrane protein YhaH (DUF805 family)